MEIHILETIDIVWPRYVDWSKYIQCNAQRNIANEILISTSFHWHILSLRIVLQNNGNYIDEDK